MITTIQKQETHSGWSLPSLYKIGGIAALFQLATILGLGIAMAILGPKPTSAEEYFMVQQNGKLAAILRGDFLLLILIGLYLGTFPAMYMALRHINPVYTAMATLFTFIAVTGTFATESTFALLHLGDLYAEAATDAARAQFLAAGEAIIAADMWHSSSAYMAGILLQGSGVIMSLIMLRSKHFNKVTAYAGLIGNGLDLIQHIFHPFAPSISAPIQAFMGVFYLVWFPMLGKDLLKLSRKPEVAQL